MSRRVWFVHLRPWSYTAATAMVIAFAPSLFADDYLDALKGEAGKIDAGPAAASASQDSEAPPPLDFERELDRRYHGTYLFYKQLPGRSREEILQAHANGASMEEIRKKIMDRFLHKQ